jgi:hypothetical protein
MKKILIFLAIISVAFSAYGQITQSSAGDITGVTAGSGLTGGGTSAGVTLNVGAGFGITVASDAVAADSTKLATLYRLAKSILDSLDVYRTSFKLDTTKIDTAMWHKVMRRIATASGITAAQVRVIVGDSVLVKLQGTSPDTVIIQGSYPVKLSGVRITGQTKLENTVTMSTIAGQQILAGAGSSALPQYSAQADPNTGMYLPGSDVIGLNTNATRRVTVLADGKVGIGTSAPDAKLSIVSGGDFKIGAVQWDVPANDSINGAFISSRSIPDLALPAAMTGKAANVSDADMGDVTISSGAWAVENDSHGHTVATITGLDSAWNSITLGNDAENVSGQINFVASDNDQGSVAITTADALSLTGFSGGMNVTGSAQFGKTSMPIYITDGGRISTSTLADTGLAKVVIKPVTAISPLQVQTSGGTVALAVGNTNGYVGIGKTNPASALDVTGTISASAGIAVVSQVNVVNGNVYDSAGDFAISGEDNLELLCDGGNNDATSIIRFGTNSYGGAATEWAQFSGTGNLGIGTTAPTAKAHLSSSGSTTPLIFDHGNFAAAGDARASYFVLRDTTQSSQSDTLHLDGSEAGTNFFAVEANCAKYFKGMVVGWCVSGADDNKAVCYEIEGLIQRDGSNNTTLPWSAVAVKYEHTDLTDCNVTLSADDTGESLNIIVNGKTANTIRWVATVRSTHVGG